MSIKERVNQRLNIVYVSSGKNVHTINHSIAIASKLLAKFPNVNLYTIFDNQEPKGFRAFDSEVVVVPNTYVTPKKTHYKARALYYFHTVINKKDQWTLHLDEESIISSDTISKTLAWIQTAKTYTIGQGLITYGNAVFHPIFSMIEGVRSLFDVVIYKHKYSQEKTEPPVVIHGSLLVLSRQVGLLFDAGQDGAMAEDTYLANKVIEMGGRVEWINTSINEQPPLNLHDYFSQRIRWYRGLLMISQSKAVKLPLRKGIRGEFLKVALLQPVTMLLIIAGGIVLSPIIAAIPLTMLVIIYLSGLLLTYRHATLPVRRKFWLTIWLLPLTLPIAIFLDSFVGIFAALSNPRSFQVIKK